MSQRVKRPNRTDDGSVPTKRRKRPTVEEEEAATLAAASWQPRPFNDLKSIYNRTATEAPAELFRKDLISAMKLPDSEPLASDEYWVIVDQWKQEWERGVQVPVNPDSLPEPCVTVNQCVPVKSLHEFRMPKNKYIRITKDENFSLDEHILSTAPTKAEAACFYDLDECDVAWLKLLNGERAAAGMGPVSEEQLERVIERLEINCWEKLQSILRNEEGLGIEYDENVICDVCRSPDSEEGNEMVFCDSCNICVHQACYGITRIPEGQWLCGTCTLAQRPDCVLCPNKGGAMKATRSGQKWAHVSCALWIPEVSIGCVEKMEPITKISSIPQSRWALICVLCRERVGACIQCSVKTCKTAYHVTCAFKHGLEMRAIIEDENADDGVKLRSYCEKHSKTSKKEKSVCSGSDDDDNKRKKRKDMTSEEKNQARAARLQEIECEFDKHVSIKDVNIQVDVDNEALHYIYNYWTLKRRAGNNRPLLLPKFEDVDMLSHKQEQADLEKMKMFVQLRQDLERVRNLCYMVSRREKLSRTFFRMREQTFHKQAAVLASAGHSLSPSIIQAVIEANHGPSIYDKLYSHSDAEDHTKDFDLVLARIAGIKSPLNEYNDIKKPELNGLLKSVKDNPYKKLYFNGSSKRRSASLYGSSTSGASSSDELSKDINRMRSSTDDDKVSPSPVLKKKVVKSHKRNINNKRKRISGASHSKVDSSSEDDVRPSKNDWKKLSRSRLQQMEHELGVSGTDSDGVMTIHASKSEESQKVKAASIYSDSDTDSSMKKFNKSFGTQHNRLPPKPPVKEFSQKPLRSPKKVKEKKVNKTSKKEDKKDYVPSDLIVPQRQAAKKASENLKSTSSSRIKDQLSSSMQPQQTESETKAQPPVSSDDKLKHKSKLKAKETKLLVTKKEVKHFNDVFDIEKELDKEENSEILSYVPQRQAAKKAAEHIKSGLVKPSTDTSTSETEKIKRDQEVKSKTDLKVSKKDTDSEKPAKIVESRQQRKSSSNSSSSSTSNSSSDSASSSTSESEDEPSKSQQQSRSESLFSSPVRDQTKRANPKDWPFLDKAAKSAGCSSTSESSDSSRPSSPIKSSVVSPSKTAADLSSRNQETVRAKPTARKLPDKKLPSQREEPSRMRTGGRGRPSKGRTRSRNSCDTVGDAHVRPRDIINTEPVEERDLKSRKGKSNEMAESPKKEISKSDDLFVAFRKEDKKLNDKIERLDLSNLEREILERKAGRDKEPSSNKSKCSLDRLLDLKYEKSRSIEKLLKLPEKHSKLVEIHEGIQSNNTELTSPNKISKSPDWINKSPDKINKVNKSPKKVRKSPERVNKSFEKIRKSPDKARKSPDRVNKSLDKVRKSPEKVRKSPDKVRKSPEKVSSKSPDMVCKLPEKVCTSPEKSKSLDKPPKSPEKYSIAPDKTKLSDKHSKSPEKSTEKHLKSPAEKYMFTSPVKENKEPPSFEQEDKIQASPVKYKSVESSNVADNIKRIKTTPKFNNIQEEELPTKPYVLEENRRFGNEDENKKVKMIEVQKVYETTNNKIAEIQNELEGKGQMKLGRSIFSPPHANKDSDLLDFDILDDGFGIPKDEEIMKGPLSFAFTGIALFKEDSKEDSARETLNLVEKLRFELSKKSTTYDVDDTASIASSTRNDGERIDMEQIVPNDLGEIPKDEKITENHQLQLEVRVNVTDMPKPMEGEEKMQDSCENNAFMQSDKVIHQQPHELLDHSSSAQADERWVPPSDSYADLDPNMQPPLQTYNTIPQAQTYIQQFPNSSHHQIIPPQIELRVQEEMHKNLSPSLHDRRVSQTPYLEQSSLDCMPSPSPYADMHPQAKWADSQIMPTRRSSSSSAASSSSSCSRRNDVEDELMKRTEVMMINHPNLELQFGVLHQGIPPFPPNSLDPYPPYSESQFVSPVSLFPPPPNINTQIPFPSPGAAMFPPAFGNPFPTTHSVIPPLPKPVDDSMRFPTACTAAFTSSQHNMALTAAMVNLPQLASKEDEELPCVTEAEIQSTVAEQLPSSPPPNVTLSAQSPVPSINEPSPTLSNTTPTTNHVEPSPNASLKSNSSGGKKSPSKPTRTSARFISQQQNKSPSKSPAGKSPSGPGRGRSDNKRGSGRGASRGQSQTRGRGRGRGRGKSDYGNSNTIHNKLIGTVYDLDFDDDISTDNMGDLKAMRERRKSADVHDRKLEVRDSSQSPKFASPSSHKGRSYNDLRDLRPPTPINEEKCDSPVPPTRIVEEPPQFPDIVQPVLPGPVDMRTYNSFDSQSYTEANLLGVFASGTVAESQVHEDIDEDFEKELHSALTGSKRDGESEPPAPEIANNIKVSLSDSRNQLKVKIKGPIANYTSSVVPPLPPAVVDSNTASNISTNSSNNNVMTNVSMGMNSGTSNLRRMRKKELLRQYWTQDMNNMDEPANSGIVAAPAAPQINRTIITIPKAVASMTSIPTRDDYRDYRTGTDDILETKIRKESKARGGALSRELRHLDLPIDDDVMPERRRSIGSTGSNECVIASKRRGRPASGKQLQTPKLKIKISGNSIVGGVNKMDEKKDRIRPPKKRLATIAQPSVEDLKRESMKFRKMVMADFGEVRKKKKDKSSKHKKRKTQEVQIISNNSTNSTKLIIRFGRKTSSSENQTNKRTSSGISVDSKILASPIVDLSKDVANVSKVCEPIKVTPIKLKLSRCQEGSGYFMKSTELDDVKAKDEGKKAPSPPPAPPPSLLSPLKLPEPAHTPPAPLPISKDCEVR